MSRIRFAALVLGGAMAAQGFAQPMTYDKTDEFRSEVRATVMRMGNFYQASDPDLAEAVQAAGLEYRFAWRPQGRLTDLYAHAGYMFWGDELDGSPSARVGMARQSDLQSFNVFVHHSADRPTFDVANTFSTADTTLFSGEYSYRVVPNWGVGVSAQHETQSHTNSIRDNDYTGLGVNAQYFGFGGRIIPRVGFTNGVRDVPNNGGESFDEDDFWVELSTEALYPAWMSLTYHTRGKSYSINDPASANFNRRESGPTWELFASYRMQSQVTLMLYATRESVNSTLADTSFDTNLVLVGVAYGF